MRGKVKAGYTLLRESTLIILQLRKRRKKRKESEGERESRKERKERKERVREEEKIVKSG